MSLIRRCDEYLFHDPDDRITLCDDSRAHVRLPARALRSTGRNAWLIATCSWTNVLCPITLFAIMLDPSNLSLSASFWLNYTALISLVGLFRYASEVLSVEAPAPVKKIWNATLGSFSPDLEVSSLEDNAISKADSPSTGRLHCAMQGLLHASENLHNRQNLNDAITGQYIPT